MYYDSGAYGMLFRNLKKRVVKLGVKKLSVYVFIWQKLKMKANIVFPMKTKTLILTVFVKKSPFNKIKVVPN